MESKTYLNGKKNLVAPSTHGKCRKVFFELQLCGMSLAKCWASKVWAPPTPASWRPGVIWEGLKWKEHCALSKSEKAPLEIPGSRKLTKF